MTITSVDEFVVVCMSVGFPPVNFTLVVFFRGLALVDFWGGDDFLFWAKNMSIFQSDRMVGRIKNRLFKSIKIRFSNTLKKVTSSNGQLR